MHQFMVAKFFKATASNVKGLGCVKGMCECVVFFFSFIFSLISATTSGGNLVMSSLYVGLIWYIIGAFMVKLGSIHCHNHGGNRPKTAYTYTYIACDTQA